MNSALLLEHYARIADAPDAIVRLRALVVALATLGRITGYEGPWLHATLGDLGRWGSGGTPSKSHPEYYGGEIPWVVIGDLNDGIVNTSQSTISHIGLENSAAKIIEPGAVLIAMYGSIGKLGINAMPCATNQAIAYCHTFERLVSRDFFFWLLRSLRGKLLDRGQGVAQQNISQKILKAWPVELPELAEQQRIVAKVEELMELCDQLEAARAEREAGRDRLTAATLASLNAPEPETFPADARFALDSLTPLTTRPDQIKHLRQTILNLAVRGKLVTQDARGEPASEFLKQIAVDKSARAVSARDRRASTIQPLTDADVGSTLPATWLWVRFGDIIISRDGERIPVSRDERSRREKFYDYYGASGVIDKIDGFLFDKPLLLIGEDGANLINRSTPIAFVARGKYWVNNHAHVLDGLSETFLRYLELFINAIDLKPYVTGTAQPKMNQAKMNSIPVALPPASEQHRIVARVDELMALCDQLEASLTEGEQTRSRLLESVLRNALEPA